MKKNVALITENFHRYIPPDLAGYKHIGGFTALKKALALSEEDLIERIEDSGLRGRGGAAYPTGKKMRQSKAYQDDIKYLICNADEGEPGTFKDRDLLEQDPFGVLEGMVITAYAVGATHGILYLREEYAHLLELLQGAMAAMRREGLLGQGILGTALDFDMTIFSGAGAYICGEGTSLIESMEGRPGRPRNKPPYTKAQGLYLKPTLVSNVETFSAITAIVKHPQGVFTGYGTQKSPGTKLISLCGNVNNPGTYEVPFGLTLEEIITELGHGVAGDKGIKFVQVGGISGPLLPRACLKMPLTYEDFDAEGLSIGSGAVLVVDEDTDILDFLDAVAAFFKHESCGKCTPCREGNRQLMNILKRMREGTALPSDPENIQRIAHTMKYASFCGLGKTAPTALLSAIKYCPEEIFMRRGQ